MPTRRGFFSMAAAAALLAASRPEAWARLAPAGTAMDVAYAGSILDLAYAGSILDLAYAGSMAPLMEGAMKSAAAAALGVDARGRAQGASALAELIAGGSLRPDVFIAVTPGPMRVVLEAGKATAAVPIAHTEMVIAYSPRSRFASDLARSAAGGEPAWWRVLERPGFRFGRSDPRADPQGRNIIFTMQLAERFYRQPGLVERVLGAPLNPRQIFAETMLEARLQSGQLDAAAAYGVQPGAFHLPFIRLAPEINLGGALPSHAQPVSVQLDGRTYRPQPLIYYAAALKQAPHPAAAAAYVRWLQGAQAQALFQHAGYEAPTGATPLTGAGG